MTQSPPQMPRLAFLLSVPTLLKDRAAAVQAIATKYGDLVKVPVPGKPFYLATHPDLARHVLQTNAKNYRKSFDFRIVKDMLGEGLITTHDETWRHGRTSAAPAFRNERTAAMLAKIVDVTRDPIEGWESENWPTIRSLSALTLRVFVEVVLDVEVRYNETRLLDAIGACLRHLDHRLAAVIDVDPYVNTPGKKSFYKSLAVIHEAVDDWIAQSREKGHREFNLISLLDGAGPRPEDGTDRDVWLRDHLVTYLMAGHETVAVAMSWCLYLMTQYPELQKELHGMVDEVVGSEKPTAAHFAKLEKVKAVIQESMRLYPPVWSLGREAIQADTLGKYDIPAGATVLVSPYVIQRRADVWPDPEVFRPERFMGGAERDTYSYFPFSGGPRFCLGERLGMMEMQIVFIQMLQRYEITLAAPWEPKREPLISLRPKTEIPLRLKRRMKAP